ncbi:MAG: response regulator transcription factor [Deltaproteobacteria bacterium]|nr:response regulator transcription factor [Deltaproteobacteria bacterium]
MESQVNTVCVVGPRLRNNELMTSFLQREKDLNCLAGSNDYHVPPKEPAEKNHARLILWDCGGPHKEDSIHHFDSNFKNKHSQDLTAFFNVPDNAGIEEEAINRGVRGLFYESAPLEYLPKGIRAIFKGELWLPRLVMSNCILQNKPQVSSRVNKASTLLSKRETEIINLLAIGTTNVEIADKLSISLCTVKSHLYNIFNKIDVPNRLHAALWSVKNL